MKLCKAFLIISIITSNPSFSKSKEECIAEVIYAEAGGESIETVAITAKAFINRSEVDRVALCRLSNSKQVVRKGLPKHLNPYFVAIARAAMKTKSDISKGADSWNRGHIPHHKGKVKRQTKKQVYYKRGK